MLVTGTTSPSTNALAHCFTYGKRSSQFHTSDVCKRLNHLYLWLWLWLVCFKLLCRCWWMKPPAVGFPPVCGGCHAWAEAGWLHSLPCVAVSPGGARWVHPGGQQLHRALSRHLCGDQNGIWQPTEQICVANRNWQWRQWLQENKHKYRGTATTWYYGKDGRWTIELTQAIKHKPAAQGIPQLGREDGQSTPSLALESWYAVRAANCQHRKRWSVQGMALVGAILPRWEIARTLFEPPAYQLYNCQLVALQIFG